MVVLPAGRFVMGSPPWEPGRDGDEGPQREVLVHAPFAIGRHEVTFEEWDACVADGGCPQQPGDAGWGRGRRPVVNVDWQDAHHYTAWLSRRSGRAYRLPTEAEWEYAARAGSQAAYAFGGLIGPDQANFEDSRIAGTQPVGSYPANGWGLHDMHGNVAEWVEDCITPDYAGAPADAARPVSEEGCPKRVVRGGSWLHTAPFLRAAARSGTNPASRVSPIGFRVVAETGE
jgi:formylglycine-generating enzyme required for sulfatase activity